MDFLLRIWMFLCHWTVFDRVQERAAAEETMQDLAKQRIPTRMRTHTHEGRTEYLLYCKADDRDLVRYCTGWRP